MRRTILFMEWNSFGNDFVIQAFQLLGYEIERFKFETEVIDTKNDSVFTEKLAMHIVRGKYYMVFSFNYYPVVAIACKATRVPYASWTYDSPFVQLYSKTLNYETNYAFVFDSKTCSDLNTKGYTVYYLPMAAPVDCYESVLRANANNRKYDAQISFVGSLYNEGNNNLLRHLEKLDDYEKGYVDALVQMQKNIYGYNFIEEILLDNPELMKNIQKRCPVYANGDGIESAEWTFANYFIDRKITSLERTEVLKMIGEKYNLNLYTSSDWSAKGIRNNGRVDYYREAPLVFANSKINLNITLRSIQMGIPLRAFDIMACGGFLISNYQEDFLDFFEPEQDMVFYQSHEDLMDKIEFYLGHDNNRMKTAQSGYEKVKRSHTYLQRAEVILSTVSEFWR